MKNFSSSIGLFAVLAAFNIVGLHARGDGDIAANALAARSAEDNAPRTELHRTAVSRNESLESDRIKSPSGTLIHPVLQNTDIDTALTKRMPQQEDYHMSQMP